MADTPDDKATIIGDWTNSYYKRLKSSGIADEDLKNAIVSKIINDAQNGKYLGKKLREYDPNWDGRGDKYNYEYIVGVVTTYLDQHNLISAYDPFGDDSQTTSVNQSNNTNGGTTSADPQAGTSADPNDTAVDTGNNNGAGVAQPGDGGGDVGQAEIAGAAAAPPVVDGNESQSAMVNQHRHQENRSNMIDYEYSDTNVDIGIMGLSTVYSTYIVLHRDATRFFFTHSDFNALNTLYVDGDHKKLSNHGKEKYDGLKNEDIAKYSANIVQRYITVFGIEAPKYPAGSDPLDLLWEYNELCQLVSAYNKYTDATVGMYQRQAASAGPAPGPSAGAAAPAAGAQAEGASGGLTVTPIINRQVMSGGSSTMGMSTMGTLTANRKRTVYDGQGMPQRQEVRSDNTLVDPQPILSKYSKIAVGNSGVNSGAPFRKLSLNSQGVDFLSTPKNYTGQPLSTSLDTIKNSLAASGPKFLRNPINPTRIFS
jgi:hypothetical protein